MESKFEIHLTLQTFPPYFLGNESSSLLLSWRNLEMKVGGLRWYPTILPLLRSEKWDPSIRSKSCRIISKGSSEKGRRNSSISFSSRSKLITKDWVGSFPIIINGWIQIYMNRGVPLYLFQMQIL